MEAMSRILSDFESHYILIAGILIAEFHFRSDFHSGQIFPKPGWVEHDAEEIWDVTLRLLKNIFLSFSVTEIDSIGITNQRETTVLWNKSTGKPIYNAIVWQCRRTSELCDKLKSDGHIEMIQDKLVKLVIHSHACPQTI